MNKQSILINSELSASLDGVRGLAALVVFFAHYNQIFNLPLFGLGGLEASLPRIIASYAVVVFFVLSGFVITTSILNNREKYNHFNWQKYLLDRVCRIYPPYIFALLFSIGVYLVIKTFDLHGADSFRLESDLYVAREKASFSVTEYIGNFFMLQGMVKGIDSVSLDGPLWSISYEWWIYFLAMFFWVGVFNGERLLPLVAALGFIFWFLYNGTSMFVFFTSVWILGALIAINLNRLILYQKIIFGCAPFVLMSVIGLVIGDHDVVRVYASPKNYLFEFLVTLMLIYLFVIFSKLRLLSCLKYLSRFSYTLYVVHFPAFILFFSIFHHLYVESSMVVRFAVFIGVSAFVLIFSWLLAKRLEKVKHAKYVLIAFRRFLIKVI